MNFLRQTLRDHLFDHQKAAVLLSATCKGNDPTLPLCPLFHGSLGPYLFSDIGIRDYFAKDSAFYFPCPSRDGKWQDFLLQSHNITWSKHVYFPACTKLCKKICKVLSKTRYSSRSVKSVTLHRSTLPTSVPFITEHCSSVEKLIRLTGPRKPDDETMKHIAKLPFVEKLYLQTSFVTDDGLLHLSTLPNLQVLSVPSSTTDIGLLNCTEMLKLRVLWLGGCRRISDDGIGHISNSKWLEDLSLRGLFQLTDTACMHLRKLPYLQMLDLSHCRGLTDNSLEFLRELNLLNTLNLSGCFNISDVGMKHLSKLTNLQNLSLIGLTKISYVGVKHLVDLAALAEINLSGCHRICDAAIEHLSKLTCLKTLYLARINNITDLGFKHLLQLTKLQKLHLSLCRNLDDSVLRHLSTALIELRFLDLTGCRKVTEDGIVHLAQLKSLKVLTVNDCSFTRDVVNRLRTKLPTLDIVIDRFIRIIYVGEQHNDEQQQQELQLLDIETGRRDRDQSEETKTGPGKPEQPSN